MHYQFGAFCFGILPPCFHGEKSSDDRPFLKPFFHSQKIGQANAMLLGNLRDRAHVASRLGPSDLHQIMTFA
jgi:hypothetical protein